VTDHKGTAASPSTGAGAATDSDGATEPARPGRPEFRERLYLPWYHWVLPLVGAVLLGAEVDMGYPGLLRWLPYLITVPLTVLLLWRFGSATIAVRDGELWAGPAHLPLRFVDEIRIVPANAKRKVLGPGFDPAAFLLHRSWVGPLVWLRLNDPDDPTPYWLVSTRSPERLIAAINEQLPPPAADSTD
jgi:hypothetical protein